MRIVKLAYAFSVSISPTSASINIDQSVTFTANVSEGLEPYIYKWYLNGSLSGWYGSVVLFTPPSAGYYLIFVNVTGKTGATTKSNVASVTVYAQLPKASFTYDPPCPLKDQLIVFNASTSTPDGGLIQSYEWDFSDGENGTGKITSHSYASEGVYLVTLRITDCENMTDTEQKQLIVCFSPPRSPIAFFTENPKMPYVNDIIVFDASDSIPGFDGISNCSITEYSWDFDSDGSIDLLTSSPNATYSYEASGTYTVVLAVYAPSSIENPAYYPYDTVSEIKTVVTPIVGGDIILLKAGESKPQSPTRVYAWIGLVSLIISIAAVSAVHIKHRKKQQT